MYKREHVIKKQRSSVPNNLEEQRSYVREKPRMQESFIVGSI